MLLDITSNTYRALWSQILKWISFHFIIIDSFHIISFQKHWIWRIVGSVRTTGFWTIICKYLLSWGQTRWKRQTKNSFNWIYSYSSCYFMHNSNKNFTENFEYCKIESAELISLASYETADFMRRYYKYKIRSDKIQSDHNFMFRKARVLRVYQFGTTKGPLNPT